MGEFFSQFYAHDVRVAEVDVGGATTFVINEYQLMDPIHAMHDANVAVTEIVIPKTSSSSDDDEKEDNNKDGGNGEDNKDEDGEEEEDDNVAEKTPGNNNNFESNYSNDEFAVDVDETAARNDSNEDNIDSMNDDVSDGSSSSYSSYSPESPPPAKKKKDSVSLESKMVISTKPCFVRLKRLEELPTSFSARERREAHYMTTCFVRLERL